MKVDTERAEMFSSRRKNVEWSRWDLCGRSGVVYGTLARIEKGLPVRYQSLYRVDRALALEEQRCLRVVRRMEESKN